MQEHAGRLQIIKLVPSLKPHYTDSGVCEKKDACADYGFGLSWAPHPPISRLVKCYNNPLPKNVFFFAGRDTPDKHDPNIDILGSGEAIMPV